VRALPSAIRGLSLVLSLPLKQPTLPNSLHATRGQTLPIRWGFRRRLQYQSQRLAPQFRYQHGAAQATPSPALAEDFTFEVPVEIINVAPGARQVGVRVDCRVSASVGSLGAAHLVAEAHETYTFHDPSGPVGPVTDRRVVTLRMDASRARRASEARYWNCTLNVSADFGEDQLALNHVLCLEPELGRAALEPHWLK
jgi:hypothetical protein